MIDFIKFMIAFIASSLSSGINEAQRKTNNAGWGLTHKHLAQTDHLTLIKLLIDQVLSFCVLVPPLLCPRSWLVMRTPRLSLEKCLR
jgi:hypothetical protein